jgi:hypothetical protein
MRAIKAFYPFVYSLAPPVICLANQAGVVPFVVRLFPVKNGRAGILKGLLENLKPL